MTITSGEPLAVVAETYDFVSPAIPLVEISPRSDPDPPPSSGAPLWVPVLRERANKEVCDPVVEVTNPDGVGAVALMVVWGEDGPCAPDAAEPLKIECSGLIRSGESWTFFDGYVPPGAVSAELYSFSADLLSEIPDPHPSYDWASDYLGFNDAAAQSMCETLFFGVRGDEDDYLLFKQAYLDGGRFAGLPFPAVKGPDLAGGGAVGVRADRQLLRPDHRLRSLHAAGAGHRQGDRPRRGTFNNTTSYLYIQNGGLQCAEVTLDFGGGLVCVLFLVPGETVQYDVATCTPPGFSGPVHISSAEPLAILAETMALVPDIVVDPMTLDFGAPAWVGSAEMDVSVCNSGPGPLTIASVQAPAAPFSIVDDGGTGETLVTSERCTVLESPSCQHWISSVLSRTRWWSPPMTRTRVP